MYKLGFDIGSTTAKFALLDVSKEIIFSDYIRHNTKINETVSLLLENIRNKFGDIKVSVKITGSAGMGISERTETPFIQEIIAASKIIKSKYSSVKTLIDIGGEDSKMIFFYDNKAPDIRMNGSCAGGTGAFIDQMATLMNIKIEDFNKSAQNYKNLYSIASRCGVFAKTDVQNLISRKISNEDIAASVFHAVAIQAMNTLARGFDINKKVMFVGGPFAFLPELRKAFCRNLKLSEEDIIIPDEPTLLPAYGAAYSINGTSIYSNISNFQNKIFSNENSKIVLNNRLSSLFKDDLEFQEWNKNKIKTKVPACDIVDYKGENIFLGIDSGSTTTKITAIGENNELLFKFYKNNKGNPIETVKNGLTEFGENIKNTNLNITYSAITGYGEDLIKSALGIDIGIVETIAHFKAAQYFNKDVSFIMDIGGQDMKAIFVSNGIVNRIELNESCSSGCGSFIENFGNSLGYKVPEFAQMACNSSNPFDLGTRCTVFMNSKVKQALKENAHIDDISAGLAISVIKNALYKVLKLRNVDELGKNIVVQGGTFRNPSVHRALEVLTKQEVICSDIPELMGAYGAALVAKEEFTKSENKSHFIGFKNLFNLNDFETQQLTCKGCENFCLISKFKFNNSKQFYSGNKCEKIFTNKGTIYTKGFNFHDFKYKLLFDGDCKAKNKTKSKIGIPRILNMYENFPFWNTLFTELGYEVILSSSSTMKLYEEGAGTVMSDNICFPAKLVHGHIYDLAKQKVDRIFYPIVIYENQNNAETENSFNCPIVSSYPDVVRSAINTFDKFNIELDSPIINFKNDNFLKKSCYAYFKSSGISRKDFNAAFEKSIINKDRFTAELRFKAAEIIENSIKNNSLLIVLAGRPYHIDPLINHKTPEILSDLGIDVITEDVVPSDLKVNELDVISQWSYPNRIMNSAQWVSKQNKNIQLVQINSFGCGPDAILIDECNEILKAAGKTHTLIRVDEITSTSSVRLRLRSLVESLKLQDENHFIVKKERRKVKNFEVEDKRRTILAPYFADFYSDLIPELFSVAGYKIINLPKPDKESVNYGLKYSNNEICYPATIVVGDVIKAIESGKYDRNEVAFGVTQTGGQCRATTYLSLIKKALIGAGYEDIPVVTVGTSGKTINSQPGFQINWLKMLPLTLTAMLFTDSLSKLYYSSVVREVEKGTSNNLKDKYLSSAKKLVATQNISGLFDLLKDAVLEFNKIEVTDKKYPQIGIVGEIYVKFNSFGHGYISDWLVQQGVEVIFPPLLEFFTQEFVNIKVNQNEGLTEKSLKTNTIVYLFEKYVNRYISRTNKILKKYKFYTPFHDIHHIAENAKNILSLVNQFGEGWLIPAEIGTFAKEGMNNVVSVQPFGCIANQIISKGVEKRIKDLYPNMNLLFLDFDDGASEVNVLNRLHFMVTNLYSK
jgi:predicted CoA-substrate-specific enzyme activase